MGLLTRENAAAMKAAVPTQVVDVPECGEGAQVKIRGLLLGEYKRIIAARSAEPDDEGNVALNVDLMLTATINDAGDPAFQPGDEALILDLPPIAVFRVGAAVVKLSRLTADEAGKA